MRVGAPGGRRDIQEAPSKPPKGPRSLRAYTSAVVTSTQTVNWPPLIVLVIGSAATVTLAVLRAGHKVRIDYEVDGSLADWHARLRSAWPQVAQVGAIWRVVQQGKTQNFHHQKINAGADHIVSRDRVSVTSSPHGRVVSNTDLPTFRSGKHSLAFLPDRILMRSASKWCELDYRDLHATCHTLQFVESGGVPRDSDRVGTTWQYVNKSGGPDRRFTNNRQLPVMLYGEVELTTPTGLRWMLQLSRPDTASVVADTLQAHPSLAPGGH
ncbi:hypothetical protein Acsp02_85090 [Actinoplanes sp. NBRC 103695]|nr:hypothetical protein Acsp02_85090 [Actinoplanes sp. NBRC 103695]